MPNNLNLNYNDIRLLMDGYVAVERLSVKYGFAPTVSPVTAAAWFERRILQEIGITVTVRYFPRDINCFAFAFDCGEDQLAFQLKYIT